MSDERGVRVVESEATGVTIATGSFWSPPTPDDFVRESGVAPYTFLDPDEVDGPEDVKAFLDSIFGDRTLR